jgi:hypothetical protein
MIEKIHEKKRTLVSYDEKHKKNTQHCYFKVEAYDENKRKAYDRKG